MRYQGRITRWIDDKGYGYVTWHGGGEPLFIHVKAFAPGSRRPIEGDIVIYEHGKDERDRGCAIKASFPRKAASPSRGPATVASGTLWAIATLIFVVLLCGAVVAGRLPVVALAVYAGASLVTFLAYGFDKVAATQGQWRTPESTLLFLGLIGGWLGGVLGQRVFRHKLQKASFMAAFLGTVVINVAALSALAIPVVRDALGMSIQTRNSAIF